jgi:antitoxin ParD1/3/4
MATRNINLTDALDRFVAEKVDSGSYQNASEVIRAGLRLLQEEEKARAKRIAALEAAIQVGLDDLDAGRVIEVTDIKAFMDEIEREVIAEWEAEQKAPAK